MSHGSANLQGIFEPRKAIAAMAYLVQETGASMYSVMKMLYLADKSHLERHGRFITGDQYVAMKQGPVPSHAYNMIKHARGESRRRDGDELVLDFLTCDAQTHAISIKAMPDLNELSQSDMECLAEIAGIYKRIGHWAIRDMSHDAAWDKAWKSSGPFNLLRKSANMPFESIVADVDETGTLLAHLKNQHPGAAPSR